MSDESEKKPPAWQDVGGKEIRPSVLEREKALLESLKTLLQGQMTSDQKTLVDLRQKLARLKYGGGR